MLFDAYAGYPDGSVLGEARLVVRENGPLPVAGARVMLMVSGAGSARVIARPPPFDDDRWMMTIAGLMNAVPFALRPQVAIAPDGSRFAFLTADQSSRDSGTYTVSLFRANGDTIFVRSYPYRGVPIPESAVDSAAAAIAQRVRMANEVPSTLAARFQALAKQRVPPVYAPVQRITLGLDSTVWIDLRPTAEGQMTLVLDERGKPIGSVIVPPGSRVQQASRSHVWMTEIDEYGLASIVRYRVRGLSCAGTECRQ
jgi:hypothetical protein